MGREFRGKEQSARAGHPGHLVFNRKPEDVGAPNSECRGTVTSRCTCAFSMRRNWVRSSAWTCTPFRERRS